MPWAETPDGRGSGQAHSGPPSGHAFSPLASSLFDPTKQPLTIFFVGAYAPRTATDRKTIRRPTLKFFSAASKPVAVPSLSWAQEPVLPSGCATRTTPEAQLVIASAASTVLSRKCCWLSTSHLPWGKRAEKAPAPQGRGLNLSRHILYPMINGAFCVSVMTTERRALLLGQGAKTLATYIDTKAFRARPGYGRYFGEHWGFRGASERQQREPVGHLFRRHTVLQALLDLATQSEGRPHHGGPPSPVSTARPRTARATPCPLPRNAREDKRCMSATSGEGGPEYR